MSFQSISENIERLKGNEQFEIILKNPNETPSLYFADLHKEQYKMSDLEKYFDSLSEESKKSIYAKRIISYLLAMKSPPLKKG